MLNRLQSWLATITLPFPCAFLVIASFLMIVMATGLPAEAADRLIKFEEAMERGAVFETVSNPANCDVRFRPDLTNQASGIVSVDCALSNVSGRHNITVRLFARMVLPGAWVIAQAEIRDVDGPPVEFVFRRPDVGTRNLWIEVPIPVQERDRRLVAVTLTVKPGVVAKPFCPKSGSAYTCSANADCDRNHTCDETCRICVPSPRTEPAVPRVITLAEMRDLGFGTPNYPATGFASAMFRFIWEGNSQNNPANRCPSSFDNGRTSAESIAINLNCTSLGRRLNGAQASFDMFKGAALNSPWEVESASVTPFDTGKNSTVEEVTTPQPGSGNAFTRVRLNASRGQEARAAVSIRIRPVLPNPLAECALANPIPLPAAFVCSVDRDCPVAGDGKPRICSVLCGNRCIVRL
jgi:hypothetical protein